LSRDRYLVTGGAGFIGSNLAESLLRDGHDVRVIDDLSTGRRENLAEVDAWAAEGGGSFELHEADIRDAAACAAAMEGVTYVLHEAAIPSVQRSVRDPWTTNGVNVNGSLQLLTAARDAGVQRFVFASSSSIYGESPKLPKVETMESDPISPYGLQKLAAESYCRMFYRLYQLPTVCLRYFNVFGPRQDPGSEYSAVIPRFITSIRDGRTPVVYGDGGQTRDFTFVQNVVDANRLACQADECAFGKKFNIACGERISLLDLIEKIGKHYGVDVKPQHAAAREGDIRHSEAGIDRAAEVLGYRPKIDLDEGLRRTAAAS